MELQDFSSARVPPPTYQPFAASNYRHHHTDGLLSQADTTPLFSSYRPANVQRKVASASARPNPATMTHWEPVDLELANNDRLYETPRQRHLREHLETRRQAATRGNRKGRFYACCALLFMVIGFLVVWIPFALNVKNSPTHCGIGDDPMCNGVLVPRADTYEKGTWLGTDSKWYDCEWDDPLGWLCKMH
ncbi:hypothetical protein LTR50_000005 [Elasticomyces elasticus]|nr:hypothetical protein LTR50_000005 [Elasticomyces elasticus]